MADSISLTSSSGNKDEDDDWAEIGGNETDGCETDGNETDGCETGNNKTGGCGNNGGDKTGGGKTGDNGNEADSGNANKYEKIIIKLIIKKNI